MQILLKLFATLADHLPTNAQGNQARLEVAAGTTVGSIVAELNLPPHLVHLVLVNGAYVSPEDRPARALSEGDQLAIWPPIAGG